MERLKELGEKIQYALAPYEANIYWICQPLSMPAIVARREHIESINSFLGSDMCVDYEASDNIIRCLQKFVVVDHVGDGLGSFAKINALRFSKKETRTAKEFVAYMNSRPPIDEKDSWADKASKWAAVLECAYSGPLKSAILRCFAELRDSFRSAPDEMTAHTHHLQHACGENFSKIIFFETKTDLHLGKYTVMNYGSYVRKYMGCTDEKQIEWRVADWRGFFEEPKISYTKDSQEIVDAYLKARRGGCGACMSHPASKFQSNPIHPVSVYGGESDFALVYIQKGDAVYGRCIVDDVNKRYVRIYPSSIHETMSPEQQRYHDAIKKWLSENGYKKVSGFAGSKFNLIRRGANIVAPYIDGDDTQAEESPCGKFIIVTDDPCSEYDCQQYDPGGFLLENERSRYRCDSCEDRLDEDDCMPSENGTIYCESCYYERFSTCNRCGREESADDVETVNISIRRGRLTESWCRHCVEEHAFSCEECEEIFKDDLQFETKDGCFACESCFNSFSSCYNCTDVFADDQTLRKSLIDSELRCKNCADYHDTDNRAFLIGDDFACEEHSSFVTKEVCGDSFFDSLLSFFTINARADVSSHIATAPQFNEQWRAL